jgi:PPOX class probable F420-dependent enzyme
MHIDTSTPFGQRVVQRLREDVVIWLTTVRADGTPEPSPVWFLWDQETFLIYSLRDTTSIGSALRASAHPKTSRSATR